MATSGDLNLAVEIKFAARYDRGSAAAGAEILGGDPVAARAIAARIWDRTPGTAPPVQMANQMGMVFSRLDCKPRWRERLPEIEVPTLVVHGRRDRFFPVGNGEAIAREIPGARLLVLATAEGTREGALSPLAHLTSNVLGGM